MLSGSRVLSSVMVDVPSAEIIRLIMETMFEDARTVLDMTYGAGRFWDASPRPYRVITMDIDPGRRPDLVGDFRQIGAPAGVVDVAVFDPPYISNPSRSGTSIMASRFGGYENVREMERSVKLGVFEAWRLSRLGIIVKVQNHIHGGKFVHMTRWVEDALVPTPLYDELHVSSQKIDSWSRQLSVRHNSATYLIFRHGNQQHRRHTRV